MKQKVLLILFLGASLNFYAQKKDNYYTAIDKSLVDKHYSDYKIDIPKDWFSYRTDPGMVAHSPNEFKNKIQPNGFSPSVIIHKKNYKRKNLEKSLKAFLNSQKQFYKNFKYEIFKEKHALYGEYHIVKYGNNRNSKKEIVLVFIFNINRKVFHVFYSSGENDFDKYLKPVIKIINSFKVK